MKIPVGAYRTQLGPDFGFRRALEEVDYLTELGGLWLYASPLFAARPGSQHGYDGIDPNRLNPELGGEDGFEALIRRLQACHSGLLLDIVPNHMAFGGENPMLADICEKGPESEFYRFFDIDWQHPEAALAGKVAAPFLGDRLDDCLERGEIRIVMRNGTLGAAYFDHFFPLRLRSYAVLDSTAGDSPPCPTSPGMAEWRQAVLTLARMDGVPCSGERDERIERCKRTLQRIWDLSSQLAESVDRLLDALGPQSGSPTGIRRLKRLLTDQHFRLCYWRTATRQINYRRFFDINGLICLRQESPAVFERTHRLIRRLVVSGKVDGLRIDHIDGLRDPEEYLRRLRKIGGDVYLVVEKILGADEPLPGSWPVQGTSGYEFADRVNRLFCRGDPQNRLDRVYRMFTGRNAPFEAVCRSAKKQVLADAFAGDLENFVRRVTAAARLLGIAPIPEASILSRAAAEILSRYPFYRSYAGKRGITGADAELIRTLAAESRAEAPELASALNLLQDCLTTQRAAVQNEAAAALRQEVAARFQQLCAPLAAKGIEDTALYRYHRLVSLNEVGGQPQRMGISRAEFHEFMARRCRDWPLALNALSTHDSKRSADVRARINVLSELPEQWEAHCTNWRRLNRSKKDRHRGAAAPDANSEYLLYQTLVGTLPVGAYDPQEYARRIRDYMRKAAREAKEQTSWLTPDSGYEDALDRFIDRLLLPTARDDPFGTELSRFAGSLARWGVYNSLAQTLIHLTAPGIPDIYQGTELFDFSLVDPDNRRPVDFDRRRHLLREIQDPERRMDLSFADKGSQAARDRLKLHLIRIALQVRRRHPELFQSGSYLPLEAAGRFENNVIGFARHHNGNWSLTVVPRWLTQVIPEGQAPLGGIWRDTVLKLPSAAASIRWTNELTGERHKVAGAVFFKTLFGRFPAALLTGETTP